VTEAERAQLIERHLDVARRGAAMMAKRVAGHVEFDDLLSIAHTGLVEAARTFDASRGTPFGAWAWYRVQGALVDSVRKNTTLPRRVWRQIVALRAAAEYLEHAGERDVGATQRGSAPKQGQEALAQIKDTLSAIRTMYVTSLDALSEDTLDAKGPKQDTDPVEQIDTLRLARKLRKALTRLTDKERALVTKHYYEGKNLLEAGAELGISKSWASRLHAQAVEKLRAVVDAEAIV